MRRAPIVVGATAAGLAAVLGFHTPAAPVSLGGVLSTGTSGSTKSASSTSSTSTTLAPTTSSTAPPTTVPPTTAAPSTTEAPTTTVPPTTLAPAETAAPTTVAPTTTVPRTTTTVPATTTTVPRTTTTVPATTTTLASAARTAVGAAVNYNYGIVSISATVSGSKITKIAIASLNDMGNFRSESIDQQSLPILIQEALQAQSANVQGVSGATYTSAGFAQSLQSALSQLGR